MKVVHFGKYFPPDVGGIESATESVARGTASKGFKVWVIAFSNGARESIEVLADLTVHRVPAIKIGSQPLSFRYILRCLRVSSFAEIVHLHSPNYLAAIAALFLRGRTKLVTHWHSDIVNKGMLSFMLKPIEILLLRRSDRIIVTSSRYLDGSKSLRSFRNKVSVIPLGIAPRTKVSADCTVDDNCTSLTQAFEGKKVIFSVGRLVSYKGFDTLISAAKFIRDDAVVVICGDGPERNRLVSQVSSKNLTSKVYFIGRASDSELIRFYENSHIFCLPSVHRAEAFGVVLLEAMSHGLPIVATEIEGSGVSWVNCHGVSGLNVSPRNARALADACNTILADDSLRQAFSEGARSRFYANFTEEITGKAIVEVYKELLGSSALPPRTPASSDSKNGSRAMPPELYPRLDRKGSPQQG